MEKSLIYQQTKTPPKFAIIDFASKLGSVGKADIFTSYDTCSESDSTSESDYSSESDCEI